MAMRVFLVVHLQRAGIERDHGFAAMFVGGVRGGDRRRADRGTEETRAIASRTGRGSPSQTVAFSSTIPIPRFARG